MSALAAAAMVLALGSSMAPLGRCYVQPGGLRLQKPIARGGICARSLAETRAGQKAPLFQFSRGAPGARCRRDDAPPARSQLAACRDNMLAKNHVVPADLPACSVYLYEEATQTHVYLVGSIHVSKKFSTWRTRSCSRPRAHLHSHLGFAHHPLTPRLLLLTLAHCRRLRKTLPMKSAR